MVKRHNTLATSLKKLLFERNMKPIDLARRLNIPQPTVHRLVTGKTTRPHNTYLQLIADFFSLTAEQLINNSYLTNSDITPQDNFLTPDMSLIKIPILTDGVATNLTIMATSDVGKNAFATQLTDSSMEPQFAKDTVLIFNPELTPSDRCFVLVKIDNKNPALFRQWITDGKKNYVKALNIDLQKISIHTLTQEDVILGVLTESRKAWKQE